MKMKDTTTEAKRHRDPKASKTTIPKATAKKAAARAGHGAVSDDAVPVLRKMYAKRVNEIVQKLVHLAEYKRQKTIKSSDLRVVLNSGKMVGALGAE